MDFHYKDVVFNFKNVPIFFDGDKQPAKSTFSNPNVTPFAYGKLGEKKCRFSYLFNPVEAYALTLDIRETWSIAYLYHPFFVVEK
jgi:hypothetical protein